MTVQQFDADFQRSIAADKQISAIKDKIEAGTATFADTAVYNERVSSLLGEMLSAHIDKIPQGSRQSFCEWILRNQYTDTNEKLAAVQRALDEAQGLHLAPQKAPFPAERVQKVAQSLEDQTVPEETIKRRANAPVANVSKSFHDDYMKENAKFRNRAGLKCFITRNGSSDCCQWCTEVMGKYDFGNAPDDIFRRHDNCECTVIYDNQVLRGRLKADGIHRDKTWELVGEIPVGFQPTSFTPEQAAELQAKNLQFKGLTSVGESGIIKSGIPYLDAKPRLEKHSIEDCYNTTNPHYNDGIVYERNCQRCVIAYEARRRGFDVIAKPAAVGDEPLKNTYGSHGWSNVFENGEKCVIAISGTSAADVENNIRLQMQNYGDGARAAVKVGYDKNLGHVFIAEQVDGETIFIDPQTGDNRCTFWFMEGMITPQKTRLLRIDDKNFTNLIEECVE